MAKQENSGQEQDERPGQEQEEEFVVVEVDDKGQRIGDDPQQPEDADHDDAEDADDEDEDERAGHAEGEEEEEAQRASETPEQRRDRRKAEKKAQRIRQRRTQELKDRQISGLLEANNALVERVSRLEGRSIRYDAHAIENSLRTVQQQLDQAKDTMAACIKAQDGEGVAEVTEITYNLRDQEKQLKIALVRARQQGQRQQEGGEQEQREGRSPGQVRQQPQLQPEAIAKAVEWAGKHKSWYDPSGGDNDSRAVQSIDNQLVREGYDPTSDDYWNELSARVKEELPHRFKKPANNGGGSGNGGRKVNDDTSNTGRRQQGGPRMAPASQNQSIRPLGKNEVRVTPERKKAMQDAGYWDDPQKRNKMLRQYAQYDRENQA